MRRSPVVQWLRHAGAAVLLVLAVMCTFTLLAPPVNAVRASVYLATDRGGTYTRIDPVTLSDEADTQPLELASSTVALSDDRRTLASIERSANGGRAWIVLRDAWSGVERLRWQPPADVVVPMLGRDGSRLVIQRQPRSESDPSTWYVFSTSDGQMLHTVASQRAGFWPSWIDPDAGRLYRLLTDSRVVVEAYDVVSGAATGELELPDVLDGAISSQHDGGQLGAALSPDSNWLAVVHPDGAAMTVVDARNLSLAHTMTLRAAGTGGWLLELFDLRVRVALAKPAEGTSRMATFGPDGHLYTWGNTAHCSLRSLAPEPFTLRGSNVAAPPLKSPAGADGQLETRPLESPAGPDGRFDARPVEFPAGADGQFETRAVQSPAGRDERLVGSSDLECAAADGTVADGLREIDLKTGRIVAGALDGIAIDSLRFSADGSAVFVVGYRGESSFLWRLDGATLAVRAQREIDGRPRLLVI